MKVSSALKSIGFGAVAALTLLAQVGRVDGRSNVSAWLDQIGLDYPGLRPPMTDNWVGGAGLVVLAALVFWHSFGRKSGAAPSRAALTNPDTPAQLPDLPLRTLFLRLAPELSQLAETKASATAIGQMVRLQLASGMLQAWGKPKSDNRMLVPIDPEFWNSAEWTFWFLPADPRNRDLVHVASPDGQVQFRDVTLNLAAAAAIWPI